LNRHVLRLSCAAAVICLALLWSGRGHASDVPTARTVSATMPTSQPTSAPAATQPVKDAKEWGRLFWSLNHGDAAARERMIGIMRDPTADAIQREIALSMLGQEGSKLSVVALTEMLLSEDRQLRTSAYYAIPEKDRPSGFEYTAAPTDATRRVIGERIAELKRETDK
jgi:hypothetical protein